MKRAHPTVPRPALHPSKLELLKRVFVVAEIVMQAKHKRSRPKSDRDPDAKTQD